MIVLRCDNNKFPGEFTNTGFKETRDGGSQYVSSISQKGDSNDSTLHNAFFVMSKHRAGEERLHNKQKR